MLWVLFLVVAWVAAIVTCARLCQAAVAAARGADAPAATDAGRALTLYETAFLSGGPYRVSELALVAMHRERRLLLAHTGWVTVVDPVGRDELERSLIRAVGSAGQAPVSPVRSALAAADAVRALADRLVAAGLAVPDAARNGVASAVSLVRGACVLVLVAAFAALAIVPPTTGAGPVAAWFALPLVLTTGCLVIARVEVHPYTRWASPAGQQRLGEISVPPREDRLPEPGPARTAPAEPAAGAGPAGVTGRASDDADARAARAALTVLAIHGAAGLADPALRAALRGGRHRGHH
ncbi:TIGR04222 domain-containing membrane protein [Streptomyces sp. 796.1]|uniref:TIGR04222 domain-containing membrane protein n=1 Tax=Streptomyces sp. 796.1 TaxID=3163029 RepID=UPI0039C8EB0F